jgi:hypothetical protein
MKYSTLAPGLSFGGQHLDRLQLVPARKFTEELHQVCDRFLRLVRDCSRIVSRILPK